MSRTRLLKTLDSLALAGLLAGILIVLAGGLSVRFNDIRLTARTPHRAFIGFAAVLLVRLALDRRTGPWGAREGWWRRTRDGFDDPHADALTPLPRGAAFSRRLKAAVGIIALSGVLLHGQLTRMDSVPDLGDPLFSIWRLAWVCHQLQGASGALFDANIFYPARHTLAYSDSMLVPAFTAMPFFAAGVHPVVTYNIVLLLSFVAPAFALYLLVERLTGSAASAFVAALIFEFYPYRFEHYAHLELLATYFMPLSLLALHNFLSSGRTRDAVIAGMLAAGQLYCSMYYAVFFLWYAATVAVILCAGSRSILRRLVWPMALAATVAAVLALPLYRSYRAAELGDRERHEVAPYSAAARDYLQPPERSALWGHLRLSGSSPVPDERALFPGLMAVILAAVALVPPIGRTRVAYAAALLVAVELSRGLHGLVYPVLYDWLPFVRGLRSPARAGMFVGMSLAILAGFGVRRLLATTSSFRARAILAGLVAAVALDLRPALALERVWPEPPPIYGSLAGASDVVLAEFPMGGDARAWVTDTAHMYFSLWHWSSLINGYSGHLARGYTEFQDEMKRFPDSRTLDLLKARGATHVSVTCALFKSGCDSLLKRIDGVPDLRLVSSGIWQNAPSRLYAVEPAAR